MSVMTIGRHRKSRRRQALIGLGSLMDLSGVSTLKAMQREMPETRRRSPRVAYVQAAQALTAPTQTKQR